VRGQSNMKEDSGKGRNGKKRRKKKKKKKRKKKNKKKKKKKSTLLTRMEGHEVNASSLIFFKKMGLPPLVNSSAVMRTFALQS
jgi:hypothetical protein